MRTIISTFACWTILPLQMHASQLNNLFHLEECHYEEIARQKEGALSPILHFNGTSSYIEVAKLDLEEQVTFCAWIKPENLLKKNQALFGIQDRFWMRTTTSRELQFTQPGVIDNNSDDLLLTSNNWMFVSLVVKLPEVQFYLNGELAGEFDWVGSDSLKDKAIFIGKNDWREDFYGAMTDIQIFDEAIDKKTMSELYDQKPYSDPILDGIVFYHSFNASHKYYSAGEYSETFNIGFLTDTVRGKVADFNGRDSYLEFGELLVDNAVTISVWVKQKTFNRDYGAIAAFGHAYAFRITTGGSLLFTIPQMADVWDIDAKITQNEWQHVAVTFKERKGVTFYLNGEKKGTFAEEKYQTVPKELQIGTNLWNDFFKGQMDDLVVWNKVLGHDEIKEVFQKNDDYWKKNVHLQAKSISNIIIAVICFLLLLITVFYITHKRNRKANLRDKHTDPFQQKILEIIHQNLADSDFSVKEFADALLMSKTKLYNEVKSSVGKSPKEYIREIRINEAARLLSESDIPVTDIVYKTGFESRAYFNKCFKAQYQVTPTQYRKTHRIKTR